MPSARQRGRKALKAIILGLAVTTTVGALVAAMLSSRADLAVTGQGKPPVAPTASGAMPAESGDLETSPDKGRPPVTGGDLSYVALGDSFTAAPYNPVSIPAGGCMRSTANYPRLLARELGNVSFVDASCGGATTENLVKSQQVDGIDHPPQIDWVTSDTDLVTLSFGLNEFNLYGRLMFRCAALGAQRQNGSAPCSASLDEAELVREIAQVTGRVQRAVDLVSARAPNAQIIVVNYPQMVSSSQRCPDRLTLAEGDIEFVASSLGQISRRVIRGAERAGADSVDLREASAGHDICSDEAWVNGSFDDFALASAYHPYPAEQTAAADLLARAVSNS